MKSPPPLKKTTQKKPTQIFSVSILKIKGKFTYISNCKIRSIPLRGFRVCEISIFLYFLFLVWRFLCWFALPHPSSLSKTILRAWLQSRFSILRTVHYPCIQVCIQGQLLASREGRGEGWGYGVTSTWVISTYLYRCRQDHETTYTEQTKDVHL